MPGQEIGNKNMLAINQHNGIEKNENYENGITHTKTTILRHLRHTPGVLFHKS